MRKPELREIHVNASYREGVLYAAYLHVVPKPTSPWSRCELIAPGLLIDWSTTDEPLGIEIFLPHQVTRELVNLEVRRAGLPPMSDRDFAPLRAA